MSDAAIQGVWLVGLAIVAILQLLAARQQTKWRLFSAGKQVFRAIWTLFGFALVVYVGGVPLNLVWAVVFAVVGAALGFVTGRLSKIGYANGKLALKRAPYAPWVVALVYITAFAFLLFGSSALYSVGLLLVLLGVMMNDGAVVAEIMKASKVSPAVVPA